MFDSFQESRNLEVRKSLQNSFVHELNSKLGLKINAVS